MTAFDNVLASRFKRILACACSVWEVICKTLRLRSFSSSDSQKLRTSFYARSVAECKSMPSNPACIEA